MPDVFTNLANVNISHIPATNMPAKIDVPNGRRTTVLKGWAIKVYHTSPEGKFRT